MKLLLVAVPPMSKLQGGSERKCDSELRIKCSTPLAVRGSATFQAHGKIPKVMFIYLFNSNGLLHIYVLSNVDICTSKIKSKYTHRSDQYFDFD